MEQKQIRGYKVFNPDWTCEPSTRSKKQYTCPGRFEENVDLECCERGMHFCENISDCFNYYSFDYKNKVAEVIAYGKVVKKGNKCCTNKLEIVREITWEEVLKLCNFGRNNMGRKNIGNDNWGMCNTGYKNIGNSNFGVSNNGYKNIGNDNNGYNCIGNNNRSHYVIGDFNTAIGSFGLFNTKKRKPMMFNKPCSMTEYLRAKASTDWILCDIPSHIVWKTKEELYTELYTPELWKMIELSGGRFICINKNELSIKRQQWWDALLTSKKREIILIPNFDPEIFYECTGIRVSQEDIDEANGNYFKNNEFDVCVEE